MESKNHQQSENSSDDEKRMRKIPKQTLLRLASDSRTKPEIKSTTAKLVEETHFEEFFEHNTSGRVARKHLSQSFSSNYKEESVVSNRSEEGRILRFLIERSEFISIKKQSVKKGASIQEKWLEVSSVSREYL